MAVHVSKELDAIIGYAREEAMRTGCYAIVTDHLFLGILRHADNDACRALSSLGADLAAFKKNVEESFKTGIDIPFSEFDNIHLSRDARNTLNMSLLEASMRGANEATSRDLLLAAIRVTGCRCKIMMENLGITRSGLEGLFKTADNTSGKADNATEPERKTPGQKPFTMQFFVDRRKGFS